MANVRTYVFLFVLLVNHRLTLSQPTFGSAIFCSLFCDDSDESSDESEDYDSYDIFGICSMCGTKSSAPAEATTTAKPEQSQPIKIMFPPANGMNLTLFNTLTGVLLDLVPWPASATTAASAAATTAAPATTAGNSSAAATTPATTTTVKK
ncbi:hypothetical protein ABMA28_001688 [Loxostege sticticalis]|uniref:Uncharacterized protein n=1 Tax=Loxostege sticticalis TaxID=481309 RepID=A0ABD0T5A5_LOXSC